MLVHARFTTTAGADPGEMSVTVNVAQVTRATGAITFPVSGESVNSLLDGWCSYDLADPDFDTCDYLVTFYGVAFSFGTTLDKTSIGIPVTTAAANVILLNGATFTTTDPSAFMATADDVARALAGAQNVTAIGIVQGQVIETVRGDAYDVPADTRRNWTFTRVAGEPWPDDLTGHTIRFTAKISTSNRATGSQTGQATVTFDGEIVNAVEADDAPQEVVLRPGSVDTSKFAIGVGAQGYNWDLVAIKDDKAKRLRLGVLTVREGQTAVG